MKLNVMKITIDRKTGETIEKTNIGSVDKEASVVAKACVTLLTGMNPDEVYQTIIREMTGKED